MGQAKRRQQKDLNYGKPVEVTTWIERSKVPNKWLVMLKVESYYEGCFCPHFKREDAEATAKLLEEECVKHGRTSWIKQEAFRAVCNVMANLIEDEDEVIAVLQLTDKGVLLRTDAATVRSHNAWLLEHDMLSKSVADNIDWST